jgi:FkbM family methyltransferase
MKNQSPNLVAHSNYGPIIINAFDVYIGQSVLKTGYWAEGDIELMKQLCSYLLKKKESITFYDVGANIGTHSLALAKVFGDKIKVRAFEAQSTIYYMLCGTIALNSLSNIHPHNLAVSDSSNETIKIQLPDYTKANNFGGFEIKPPRNSDNHSMKLSGRVEIVQTVHLDYFNEPVDFIKMDIEGMEHVAILGAIKILNDHRPCLYIEIVKTDRIALLEILKNNNYIIYSRQDDVLCIPIEYDLHVSGLTPITA